MDDTESMLRYAKSSIKIHEGFDLKPYRDTKGVVTVGWGHNLEADADPVTLTRGAITKDLAEVMLEEDISEAFEDANVIFETFSEHSFRRRAVLVEMAFNLGRSGLSSFVRMIEYIEDHMYKEAVAEMLDSKWAKKDVGQRAITLSERFREGL